MINVNRTFKFSAIAMGVIISLGGHQKLYAAEDNRDSGDADAETIVVRGARGSQIESVALKKEANLISDVISAEDIGKLPDFTISDSLQRVTGVQIRRSAGEGEAVNVRGLPQVMTQLNGEAFLTAGSVTTTQPNFSDIPSQLFSGASVVKSTSASHAHGGITGIVDLKTRRPFDSAFEQGFTFSQAVEGLYGESSGSTDPSVNSLLNWTNDKIGFLVSASYSEANLANYYSGFAGDSGWTGMPSEANDSWLAANNDANGDGDLDDRFFAFQGHSAYNRFNERERMGLNFAFQMELSESLLLTTEGFFTDMSEFDRRAGVTFSDKWQSWSWGLPAVSRNTGVDGIHTVQVFEGTGRRLKSFSEMKNYESDSQNFNIELKFDNGGAFRSNARIVIGEAQQVNLNSYADIDLANGSQWGVATPLYSDGRKELNPQGYSGSPTISVDYSNGSPVWSGVPGVVSNLNAYTIGALSSENNYDREADLNVYRFDGIYELDTNFITSFDFGVRYSERSATNRQYHLLTDIGGCPVRWRATDVVLNDTFCSFGNEQGFFTAGRPIALSSFGNDVISITDFGDASGIPAMYGLNPEAMDSVKEFHESQYAGSSEALIPGESFGVDLDETSYYFQANFEQEVAGIPYKGNFGVKVVDTDLQVLQYDVGTYRPYGAPNLVGDNIITNRSYTDVLPAMNVSFDLSDELILRAAYSETMAPLDLLNWGGGLSPTYTLDSDLGIFRVQNANSLGNPNLDPWRANNYDLSLEYYLENGGLINFGLFRVDIDSFIERTTTPMDIPDQDGQVRQTTQVNVNQQGEGGVIEGIEVGAKLFLDFLPGILSNTGIDVNLTYSPSDSGNKDVEGNDLPFMENSEEQFNFVWWYQDDSWQARIATNYRSERVVSLNQTWTEGLTLFQDETTYVDASLSYRFENDITAYLNVSNVTDESEKYYFQWEDQFGYENVYETRYTVGFRGTF